jgi:hypothetical protein
MPVLVTGIHVFFFGVKLREAPKKSWMVATSATMTIERIEAA